MATTFEELNKSAEQKEQDAKMRDAAEQILNKIIEYCNATGKKMDEMSEQLATSMKKKE